MMKHKPKNLTSAILIVLIVIVCIATANFLGIGTIRSAARIGYIEHGGWRDWSASYTMLDGKMKHTIRPKGTQKMLHIEVVTDDGSISIEIIDKDGNVIFDEDSIETAAYDVNVSGKVVVRVEADKHKGSFNIEAAEQQSRSSQSMTR